MERITGPDVAADLFGAGLDGFTDPEPGSVAATGVSADWLNAIQEELARTVEAAGLTLTPGTYTQLTAAITALAALKPDTTISPIAVSAMQNAWTPTGWAGASVVRMTLTGTQTINGLGAATVPKLIINVDTADTITFTHDSVLATATANKILTNDAGLLLLKPGEAALFWPDATTGKWRVVSLSIDPESRDHTWTGTHVFTAIAGFNAGLYGNTNLSCINGDVQAFSDFLYCNGARVPTAKQRVAMIPACAGVGDSNGSFAGGFYSADADARTVLYVPLSQFLRTGCVVKKVRVGYTNSSGGTLAAAFSLVRRVANKSTGGVTDVAEAADGDASGTAGLATNGSHIMTTGTITTTTVDCSVDDWSLRVTTSDKTSDSINWIEITFTELGPRNY